MRTYLFSCSFTVFSYISYIVLHRIHFILTGVQRMLYVPLEECLSASFTHFVYTNNDFMIDYVNNDKQKLFVLIRNVASLYDIQHSSMTKKCVSNNWKIISQWSRFISETPITFLKRINLLSEIVQFQSFFAIQCFIPAHFSILFSNKVSTLVSAESFCKSKSFTEINFDVSGWKINKVDKIQ